MMPEEAEEENQELLEYPVEEYDDDYYYGCCSSCGGTICETCGECHLCDSYPDEDEEGEDEG